MDDEDSFHSQCILIHLIIWRTRLCQILSMLRRKRHFLRPLSSCGTLWKIDSEILFLSPFRSMFFKTKQELLLLAFSGNHQNKRDILTIFTNHLFPILLSFQITSIHALKVLTTNNNRKRLKLSKIWSKKIKGYLYQRNKRWETKSVYQWTMRSHHCCSCWQNWRQCQQRNNAFIFYW